MIKCKDSGEYTCVSRSGRLKQSYSTADLAIEKAKEVNDMNPNSPTKLIVYKCTQCHKYHLTSTKRRIRC